MKKIFAIALLIGTLCGSFAHAAADNLRQALYGAIEQSVASLKNAPFGNKTVAVLPFQYGNIVINGKLKNVITQCGFNCVEGKEDPMWDQIIKEVAWDERKNDILDPATVAHFGKLKAAQILVYGKVCALEQNANRVYAEIELHAVDIATKQHIWGGSFAHRFYSGNDVSGIISLDNELRMLFKKNFAEAAKSLQTPVAVKKLSSVKTITVIPLAGDIDQYLTGLAIELISNTNHYPKNPQIPTLSQVRSFARDKKLGSDAIMYGAVRDLRREKGQNIRSVGKTTREDDIYADIQLHIENAQTGEILWSKTITLSDVVVEERQMGVVERGIQRTLEAKERKLIRKIAKEEKEDLRKERELDRKEKIDSFPEVVQEDIVDNWKTYLLWIFGFIGAVILLIAIITFIKFWIHYNNVR